LFEAAKKITFCFKVCKKENFSAYLLSEDEKRQYKYGTNKKQILDLSIFFVRHSSLFKQKIKKKLNF